MSVVSDPGPGEVEQRTLTKIPVRFTDDGCSNSPDGFFLWAKKLSKRRGFRWLRGLVRSFRWCCKIHDWRYCTRCHPPGSMTKGAQTYADKELGWNVRSVLQFFVKWYGWMYWKVTSELGGRRAWDSCGPASGELCRHGMPMPEWMVKLQDWTAYPETAAPTGD